MFTYRVIGAPIAGPPGNRCDSPGQVVPEKVVVFSSSLSVDSHGHCAIIHDHDARQTKYLIIGKPPCHVCAKCSKPPLLVDVIHVSDLNTEVEIKSRRLFATQEAQAFCRMRGVNLEAVTVFDG